MAPKVNKHCAIASGGLLAALLGILCAIIALPTYWEVYKVFLGIELRVGLTQYQACSDSCSDPVSFHQEQENIKWPKDTVTKKYYDAGFSAILFLVLSLVFFLFSLVHFAFGILGHKKWFLKFTRWAGLGSTLATLSAFIFW
jgi:hypothetical protein